MNKKWVSYFMIVGFLSSTVIHPAISIAVSQESENSRNQTETSTSSLTTMSSDVLGAPNETAISEEEPLVEKQDQEIHVEKNYDERDLSKKDEKNGLQPFVQVEIDQKRLKGKIQLSSKSTDDSKTIIEKVALHAKDENTEWQEVTMFEDSENHTLNDRVFNFEYNNLSGDQAYRIVVDYAIEESNDDQTFVRMFHKGHSLLGQVEVTEKEAVPEKKEKENEEPKMIPSATKSEEENETPVLIGPRAVNDVVYNGQYYNKTYANVTISGIKSREAYITFLRHKYEDAASTRYAVWSTDPNRIKNLCANTSSVSNGLPRDLWLQLKAEGMNVVTPWINNVSGTTIPSARWGGSKMANLNPNTTYYVWIFKTYEAGVGSGRAEFYHPQETSTVDSKGIHSPYVFKTDSAIALSITAPTFTQASATHNTIPMVGKAYTGDIFQTSGQGKVQVTSNDGTTVQDKVTNLGHTISQGGTYNSTSVSGLTAGTRYKGRAAIKDYEGTWRYSPWSGYFYTANTVNQPAVPTLNTPSASNNATAAVTATYNAGDVAAHPTVIEVQASTNNSSWSTLSTSTTPATTNPTINTGNKSVSFTLSKLNAKTKYYVRYRVRNASNVWSGYSTSREFTTGAMALSIATPTFTQTTATHNAIYMTGATYTGDIFQTSGQGKVQVTSDDGTTVQDKITNLTHTVSRGGTYHNITVPNLVAGTRYRGRVAIKDYGGTWRYSGWSGYFYTVNTVNQPAVPTLNTPTAANNATAQVSATYNAGDVAAHPTSTDIQISTNNSTWSTITADTTPAITNRVFNTGSKSVTFTLSKLNSKTKYYVRYRVRNASNVWSGYSTSREFTTGAVALSLATPTFTQTNATATSIPMVGATYTGDIFQTNNQGKVQVTSNNESIEFTTLGHTTTTGGTYNNATVTGLTAGTRYKGRVAIKDYGGTWSYSGWTDYFYTPNTVNQPLITTMNTPTAANNATAEVSATYNVGDTEAHPTSTDIQISTNNSTWTTITSETTPAITDRVFNTGSKSVRFTLSKLNATTTYYVRYRVRNASNVWSAFSSSREFTTNARQSGLYVSDTPTFNFGVQPVSSSVTNARLSSNQGTTDFGISMENVGINSNWSFAARLSPLATQDGSNQNLTGAAISFDKQLQQTTDGTTWQPVTQDFEGLSEQTTLLPSDSSTVPLWKTTSVSAGQGKFKTTIGFDSVSLIVPGNSAQKGNYYEGKIEWLMLSEP